MEETKLNKEQVAENTKEFAMRHAADFAVKGSKMALGAAVKAFVIPIIVVLSSVFAMGVLLGALIF